MRFIAYVGLVAKIFRITNTSQNFYMLTLRLYTIYIYSIYSIIYHTIVYIYIYIYIYSTL